MKMSSQYDQSGTEPAFLPPQGLLSASSSPRGKPGRATPDAARRFCRWSDRSLSESSSEDISLDTLFKMGVCNARRVVF